MPGIRTRSHWDNVPSETLISICAFLTTLDQLNMCSAYPTFEPLLLNSASLWRYVHLPFPDPMLFNYPGWRRDGHPPVFRSRQYSTDSAFSSLSVSSFSSSYSMSSASSSSTAPSSASSSTGSPFVELSDSTTAAEHDTDQQARQSSRRASRMTVLCDDRFRFLSEPEYYNLPDIDGGENDEQEENTAWVILDVLDRVPLRFVQHLSFGTPPCHLCTYPCRRTCYCECHQNEQSRPLYYQGAHPRDHAERQGQDHPTDHQGDNQPALSRPLQDLFESGLVDFSQYIDLHSLNRALSSTAESSTNGAVRGMGGGASLGTQHPPVEYRPPLTFHNTAPGGYQPLPPASPSQNHGLNQLDLHEALLQLSLVDEEQNFEGLDNASNQVGDEEDIALTEEEDLEISRQQAETRAAYQRARLLIRILSSGQLEALETLRVPWWPATRIYTIRQQLERWSFMIEQAIASNSSPSSNQEQQGVPWGQQAAPTSTLASPRMEFTDFGPPFAPWSSRWTNSLSIERPGLASNSDGQVDSESQQHRHSPGSTRFPLASLTRFSLRSGGDIVSHERHCLGTSALILSGRSSTVYPCSIASSTGSSSPIHQSTSLPSSIPVAHDSSASTSASVSPVSIPSSPSASYSSLSASASSSDPETSYPNGSLGEQFSKSTFQYCQHCGSQYLASSKATRASSVSYDRRSEQRRQAWACFCQVSCS
ncbi:MAG: hypothetical protein BYD32DRAFT_488625 [Podila humilis]|nr:MAG: hypothetical protein BYD32DRAFT_488625 [Podila humilis]